MNSPSPARKGDPTLPVNRGSKCLRSAGAARAGRGPWAGHLAQSARPADTRRWRPTIAWLVLVDRPPQLLVRTPVKHRATASFKNTSHDQAAHGEPGDGPPLSRINLAREFTGDLVGKSTAELLACTSGPDRFGYVGVDRFTGRLKGRSGSFVFQHGGMHDKGTLRPFGYVVAGSGTDELKRSEE